MEAEVSKGSSPLGFFERRAWTRFRVCVEGVIPHCFQPSSLSQTSCFPLVAFTVS